MMMFDPSKFSGGAGGGGQQMGAAGGMFARLLGRNPMQGMGQQAPGMGQAGGSMISPQVPRSAAPPQADPGALARIQQMARGGAMGGGIGGPQPAATMPAGQPAGQMGGQAGDIGMLLQRLLQARQHGGGVPPWLMQMMGRGQG